MYAIRSYYVRLRLRERVRFRDWRLPLAMQRPDVEVIRHIPYGPGGVRQQLDIYRPKFRPQEGCPVLLQIHGGAWMLGDKGGQALPLMYHLASRGWICVAANYRLSPRITSYNVCYTKLLRGTRTAITSRASI